MKMRATVILKDKSDIFWNGSEHFPEPGFMTQAPADQWKRCVELCRQALATLKVGSGQFRDQVELNQLLRQPHTVTCTVEPRRGYKLAVFEFAS